MSEEQGSFKGYAILELFGHRRLAGRVSEVEMFGGKLLRIDVPTDGDTMTTLFYTTPAIYGLTPTTEEIARAVAKRNQPEPVYRWELPALEAPTRHTCLECGRAVDEPGLCDRCADSHDL